MAKNSKQLGRSNSNTRDVPVELISTILLLLPPKALMRFMAVSKEWKNLIKSPRFVKMFREKAVAKGEDFILYMSMDHPSNLSFNLINEKTFAEHSSLRIPPVPHWKMNVSIVGCFNGILCLSELNFFGFNIYLCNPTIWKYRTIKSSTMNMSLVRTVILGFAYHSEVDDFKVLRIAYGSFKETCPYPKTHGYNVVIEVYSFKTDSWKPIEIDGVFPWYIHEATSEVVLYEALHWLVTGTKNEFKILAFDLRGETFKEMSFPKDDPDFPDIKFGILYITVFRDQLSVLIYCPYNIGFGGEICELWAMEEYGKASSWKILHRITLDVPVEKPLKITKNGDVLFLDMQQNVIAYNISSCRFTYYIGIFDPKSSFVTFTKSLALVDETNQPIQAVQALAHPSLHFSQN